MLDHAHNVIIRCDVGSTGHSTDVVYSLNTNGKIFINVMVQITIDWIQGVMIIIWNFRHQPIQKMLF